MINFTLEVYPENLDTSCMLKKTALFVGASLWQSHEELVKSRVRPESGWKALVMQSTSSHPVSANERRQFLLIRAQNEITFDEFITRISNSYNKSLLYCSTPEVFSTCRKCCDVFILKWKVQKVITFHFSSLQIENRRTFCIILNFGWQQSLFAQFAGMLSDIQFPFSNLFWDFSWFSGYTAKISLNIISQLVSVIRTLNVLWATKCTLEYFDVLIMSIFHLCVRRNLSICSTELQPLIPPFFVDWLRKHVKNSIRINCKYYYFTVCRRICVR